MFTLQPFQQARLSRDPRFDGHFFVAVKTTGIFCRPICPANLAQEINVEYFTMAQQAMGAGYRPCLRCRPDSAPQSCAWQGVNTTVERAITLLRDNLHLSIQDIADKLGITDRYLRQLFHKNLALSPKQYQLYEQVLFAKQLLHQTSLPIEHIAHASGFGDARRLQYNIKRLTHVTPKQIRSCAGADEQVLSLALAYRPPYNWPHLRDFLAKRAIPSMEHITQNSYARNFSYKGCHGYFHARHLPDKQQFLVKLSLQHIEHLKPVLQNIKRIFDLDADTMLIDQQLIHCGLPEHNYISGIRIAGIWDTFEAGCRAILGQQISVNAAIKLVGKLVDTLGQQCTDTHPVLMDTDERTITHYFPTPKQVANSDLMFLGMPDRRRATLRNFAEYYQQQSQDNPDQWLSLKGIGPWTIAYAKMRGLSDPDIWLGTDLVIKKQLAVQPIDTEIARPWRSYLTFTLWSMA
ncbi:MAG: AraC family transcriptional regulator of adaptative response / DNA-3-methyladenine glycosylase II [Paraglaciecola sp.]|jgi:AraC family transcriptional regulator of adaptative response / DNA-3-methyladenine glycosylase II